MKLLIVLSIREMQNKVGQLLEEAGVQIFSVTDITGYKNRQHNIGWFGSHNGKENSILLFSFTDAATAEKALRLIEQCDVCNQSRFPLRGFVLDVESFAHINGEGPQ
ncbi:MAG: hypothetical protein EOM31_10050 [Bacteroidia bacterium]|nr:hypothetical protein [Bacteroidia bacterium]